MRFEILWRDRRVLAALLALLIFVIDVVTPLGVASAVPYASVILLTLSRPEPKFTVAMAALCAVLTILDLFVSVGPGNTEYWKVLVNRALALYAIGVTTTLGVQRNRAAEEARQHLNELARVQRDQSIEQLATAMAHELNQPLAACSLQAELALAALDLREAKGPSATFDVRALLQEIVEQSQRASSIVKTLRGLVRNNRADRVELEPNSIAVAVQRWFEPTSRQHGVQLELQLAQQLPKVRGDRVQLEQVLMNLLQNACDAITSSSCVERTITLRTQVSPDGVKFSVSDTGPGVPSGLKEKLFERFYTSKPDGMGIGLAMSRTIIAAHGGRLWLDEAQNSQLGATFSIVLPRL